MSLYEEWKELIDNQTEDTFPEFWKEYSESETQIYSDLLDRPGEVTTGVFREMAEKYQVKPAIFMGFLDGINTSLQKENDFESFDETSQVQLDIDLEKLYYNMLVADAEYLYKLPQWDTLLEDGQRAAITKRYKQSKTVVKGEKVGRNDPCPCGSGKKYKKCCGKD